MMEASREPKDKNYNLNVETLKSYAQDAEQEGDQEIVSSSTRSSRTTGGAQRANKEMLVSRM
jgi:hypothetical protein